MPHRQDRSQRFVLGEEEQMLRDTARAFVADRMPVTLLRKLRDAGSPDGFDRQIWSEIAALGWPGIAIVEEHGGAGLGIRALAAVIEEMGKTLAASPLASTALVAAPAIGRFADAGTAARWLPGIASGTVIAALAVDEGPQPSETPPATALAGAAISGSKRHVADGAAADLLLVSASDGDEVVLALVRAEAPGVAIERRETIDSRGLADIRFDAAPVDSVLRGEDIVEYARDCARIGLSAEMLGACSQAFDVTLDYLRTRQQFGQVIGSFQALQHRAATLFIELELARSCVHAAADALHRDDAERPALSALAKATAAELMRLTAYEMIQLHGGIGMTDAHDAGLYLKRGRVAALLHGDAAFHRDRYARLRGY
jgi:alkylation response protein AidB-like acyl-CoA dehydrogenase